MPFYRSNFGSSSGGGGGGGGDTDSPYFSFTSTDNSCPILLNATFNTYANYDDAVITNIKIGNRVQELYYCFGDCGNLNAPVDLRNATILHNMEYFLYNCSNFNSTFYFPDNYSDPTFPNDGYSSVYYQCGYLFGNCSLYNQPTSVRMHDYINIDHYTSISFEDLFCGCKNLNSKIVFDLEKTFTNNEYIHNSIVFYTCRMMFENCTNFNQPMVFPAGMVSTDHIFNYCSSFNQPVVFDLYSSEGVYFTDTFRTALNMHSSIVILNSDTLSDNSSMFRNFVNSAYANTIYIQNSAGILNNNVIGRSLTWTTSTAPNNASCNVYYNSDYNITISEDVDEGLNQFNNYYYNFYGEYPVIHIYNF